jgi:hypothetical protein
MFERQLPLTAAARAQRKGLAFRGRVAACGGPYGAQTAVSSALSRGVAEDDRATSQWCLGRQPAAQSVRVLRSAAMR